MCAKPPPISLSTPPLPPPPSSSVSASSVAGTSTSRATGWMPETRNAERRKVAALRKKTVGTFVAVTSSAPSAGPMKNARLSMVLEAPFAAVSSAGLLVSDGIQAIWAGRKTQPTRAARVATTRTDQVGASDEHEDRGDRHEAGAHEVGADEDRLAGEAVGERRAQRGGDGHEEEADRAPDADELDPAGPVGPHDDGGGVRPVADHRAGEGELDPAQRRVDEHRPQGGPRLEHRGTDGARLCQRLALHRHVGTLRRRSTALLSGTLPPGCQPCPSSERSMTGRGGGPT